MKDYWNVLASLQLETNKHAQNVATATKSTCTLLMILKEWTQRIKMSFK
jgi:hypothetical protein